MNTNEIRVNEIMDKVYIGIQRTSDSAIAKKKTEFDGIEKYLWVRVDNLRSFKVPKTLECEALWDAAYSNTFATTKIRSLAEVMSEMMGGIEVPEMEPVQYVVTNGDGYRGAAVVLNRTAIAELGKRLGVSKFWMLPSSIHEVLLIPDSEDFTRRDLDTMVRQVNATQVDYDDQLGDCAYEIIF